MAAEGRDLQRGLHQRRLSLIDIAGAIDMACSLTGFLDRSGAVQEAGPLGALLGYTLEGLVIFVVQFAPSTPIDTAL
ncbi:hypothetical protein SCUCBS95973_009638, partial [Sporothrix curviconia]